jgi:hypothetical protein
MLFAVLVADIFLNEQDLGGGSDEEELLGA